MSEVPTTDLPNEHPTASGGGAKSKKKGAGAKAKGEMRFRQKKNESFQAELTASILRRLKVSDPTTVNAINLESAIIPARVPISFRGLPNFVYNLWGRMQSIGTRPFAAIATQENYNIFLKCIMYIAEAKVTFAQMRAEVIPPFPLTSLETFTEIQLRTICVIAKRLPYPIVIFLEAIGNFSVQKQFVIPILSTTSPSAASAAVSYAPSMIAKLLCALREEILVDDVLYQLAQEVTDLPNINWVHRDVPACVGPGDIPVPARRFVHIDDASRAFWVPPTARERVIFEKIIAAMDSKSGFILENDITTGSGSIIQTVRFPDEYNPDEDETLYYMNVEVPEFEEKLAPALMLGQEYRTDAFSRFCSSYSECLKHGSACAPSAIHAVIWANN